MANTTTIDERGEVRFEVTEREVRATRERLAQWHRETVARNEARILAEGGSLDPFAGLEAP